jgi:hypothetical protein
VRRGVVPVDWAGGVEEFGAGDFGER